MSPTGRRRFLQLSAAAAGLAAGAVGGLGYLRGSAPAVSGLQVLDAHQYRTMQQVARVHIPRGGGFALGAEDFDLPRLFDAYLADQPDADQQDARLALDLLEFGPLLFDRAANTFSHLTPAAQLDHWSSWATAPQETRRAIFRSFARFLGLAFYDQQAVWAHVGYLGPSLARLGQQEDKAP